MPDHNQHAAICARKRRKIAFDNGPTTAAGTPKRMANDEYTIGWICAIRTEYIAAQAFLDERHGGPKYISTSDNNDYTLGMIGDHNIVICASTDGEYGVASAAIVARDMLYSFHNIRICLMVGIGGGAPSPKHDIRLGDVVVSASCSGNGGVFQYDFGKTVQDQSFRTIGLLHQPPEILQIAVSGLETQYECEGHRLEAIISSVLEKKARLQKTYKRPDLSHDRLYQSEITHPADEGMSCVVVCGGDPSKMVSRPERTEVEDTPAIHYGLIASANQLMKDAQLRDTLAAEKDVICFETEVAGLTSHFPCLVIRGICDYSDSHQSKEWQAYAAMAAAAYTTELLCWILPNKIKAERKIGEFFPDS
jgi:nucleoside phosphorylase